jgi:FdhD protein
MQLPQPLLFHETESHDPMIRKVTLTHWSGNVSVPDSRDLIVEEPLAIRIEGKPYSVVMRTPGDEMAHAAGFCLTEGIVDTIDDIGNISQCEAQDAQVITITLKPERRRMIAGFLERKGFISQTSCGICGKELLEELSTRIEPFPSDGDLPVDVIMNCIDDIGRHQPLRQATHSSHAAMIADREGRILAVAEDVGRHNALDKVIGKVFLENRLDEAGVLVLSSRTSYELVQKAGRARIPVVVSVSRPTSLACDLAKSLGMTLACLAPGYGLLIFCGQERIRR